MRQINPALKSAQEVNNRYPIARVKVYDSLLRWTEIMHTPASVYSNTNHDISRNLTWDEKPLASFDADISNGHIVTASLVMNNNPEVPNKLVSLDYNLATGTVTGYTLDVYNELQRLSVYGNEIFIELGGGIWKLPKNLSTTTQVGVHSIFDYNLASYSLAMVNPTDYYVLSKYYSEIWMRLEYHHAPADYIMDYSIPVDPGYGVGSISWFDAVRLDSETDVIVLNTEIYGMPQVIVRRNGVWGDMHPMVPVDIVDNYSFLRIGWMKVYDGVIYATGELGRKGSSGKHPQSMAIVLRSKDGISWSLDRYRYLGNTPFRSPLLMENGFAYKLHAPYIERAPLTPVFGLKDADLAPEHIYFVIDSDVLEASVQMGGDGEVGSLNLRLSDDLHQYSAVSSPTYLKPGYMMKLEAGYKTASGDEYAQIHWYGIDEIHRQIGDQARTLSISATEWVMRSLANNYFDQDWQWLSQTRHYDDCNQRDYLYTIGGDAIHIVDEEKGLAIVDEQPAALDDGKLKVYGHNKRTTLVSTTPFDMKDGFISVSFLVDGADEQSNSPDRCNFIWRLGLNEYGLGYNLLEKEIGTGAGPALIEDEHNLITAFLDVKAHKLILLHISGNEDNETWAQLAQIDVSNYVNYAWVDEYWGSQLYEVWMNIIGDTINFGFIVTPTGHAWIEGIVIPDVPRAQIEASPYDPHDRYISPIYSYEFPTTDKNRAGVVVGAYIPSITLQPSRTSSGGYYLSARSLDDYDYGNSLGNAEDGHPFYVEREEQRRKWLHFWSANRGGYAYVDNDPGERILMSINYESRPVPITKRSDFITGKWLVQNATREFPTANDVLPKRFIYLNPNQAYPPGGSGSYWLNEANDPQESSYAGFWFIDGDRDGYFFWCEGFTSAGSLVKAELNGALGGTISRVNYDFASISMDPATFTIFNVNGPEDLGDRYDSHPDKIKYIAAAYDGEQFSPGNRIWGFISNNAYDENTNYNTFEVFKDENLTTRGWNGDTATFNPALVNQSAWYLVEDFDVMPVAGDRVVYAPGSGVRVDSRKKLYWNFHPVGVTLYNFIASDRESQKSIGWTIKDIVTKAGILDVLPGTNSGTDRYSIQQSFASGLHFLPQQLKDFDLLVELDSNRGSGDLLLAFGADTTTGSGDRVELRVYGTNDTWVSLKSYVGATVLTHIDRSVGKADSKRFRFVKRDDYISVWCEERLLLSYPIRNPWRDCSFKDSFLNTRYVGILSMYGFTVTQESLWPEADGIIADQGSNALQGIDRVVRDARIKIIADETMSARVSNFKTRDDLGTVPDVVFNDAITPTDRIPTHIRVVGEEIGEYFHHGSAAEFGYLFQSENVESLAEDEAYEEAEQIVLDALGNSHGKQLAIAAQLQYEPEDQVLVSFVSHDGEEVNQLCIIDRVSMQYGRATLEMAASLRKKYG